MIVDAQLHEPTIEGDWTDADRDARYRLMVETQLVAMRAVGVDSALLFPIDEGWGRYAISARPAQFTMVPMITADGVRGTRSALDAGLADELDELGAARGVGALRLMMSTPGYIYDTGETRLRIASHGVFAPVLEACRRHSLPLFVSAVGALAEVEKMIEANPDVAMVIDHLGIPQPPGFTPDDPAFRNLDSLLRMARLPNAYAKVSGLPTLSQERFPFADLHPIIHRLVDAFGARRLLWGSDISRVQGTAGFDYRVPGAENGYHGRHTYADAVGYLAMVRDLGSEDLKWIMGGTARRLIGGEDS